MRKEPTVLTLLTISGASCGFLTLIVGVLGVRLGIFFAHVESYAKGHAVINALLEILPVGCFAGSFLCAIFLWQRRKMPISSLIVPLCLGTILGIVLVGIILILLTIVIATTARFFFR